MTHPTEPSDVADTAGSDDSSTSDTTESGNKPPESWPPLWLWVARHRKPVLVVVGLVVVALAGTLVAVSVFTPGPKDVVQDYLDAIRAGDTEAALAIAGEPEDDTRLAFLSADALADDWSVDAVVERHRRDDEVDVDVTISAGDTSRQGRFHLVEEDDGWTIESPFVKVDLAGSDLEFVELGKVRQPAERDQANTVQLLLFPGVYELYPSFADRVTFEPSVLIATPRESVDDTLRLTTSYTLTDAGADAAQKALDARIDECAKKTELDPQGCPFSGEEDSAVERLTDVSAVAWTVVTHPVAHFVAANSGGVAVVVRKPGTVRLTGSGVPYEPEGAARTPFTLTCEFGLDNLSVAVTGDGIVAETFTKNRYAAALATECF